MNSAAQERLRVSLRPDVQLLWQQHRDNVQSALGLILILVTARRDPLEQDKLYAQGRTMPGAIVTNAKGGFSYHNFGLAYDAVPLGKDGQPNWKGPWDEIGEIGELLGLTWGGRWKLRDLDHWELRVKPLSELRAENGL